MLREVLDSGLRGRGGGGFPTGRKWRFARAAGGARKYLICNADEGDPGAFMDRSVLEGDPYAVLEGMTIAAHAVGADEATLYVRAEYPLAVERLRKAIAQAQQAGLLGEGVLGSDLNLRLQVKKGAGAFVCGEETALMASIEGRRGMPRPRPPFPVESGVFGRPTVINNVETFASVPAILRHGAAWYAAMGTATSKGTKVFSVTGQVARPGLVEVPMGTSLREIMYDDLAGGIPGGRAFKAVQIGGPSGGCVPERHLDVAVDYESLRELGAMMGSGGLVVMDETTCMVDVARFFLQFTTKESCGKCIPCREGTHRLSQVLEQVTTAHDRMSGLDSLRRAKGVMHLRELAEVVQSTSLCGLGQSAPNPLLSTLRHFPEEYAAHVYERRCPARGLHRPAELPHRQPALFGLRVVPVALRPGSHRGRSQEGPLHRGRQVPEVRPVPPGLQPRRRDRQLKEHREQHPRAQPARRRAARARAAGRHAPRRGPRGRGRGPDPLPPAQAATQRGLPHVRGRDRGPAGAGALVRLPGRRGPARAHPHAARAGRARRWWSSCCWPTTRRSA